VEELFLLKDKMINRLFTCIVLVLFCSSLLLAQEDQKIKIALLGTMHFEPSTSDVFKNEELSVFSEKRQAEINAVVEKIKDFAPEKILVEWYTKEQNTLNAEYQNYLDGEFKLTGNEIHQLCFKSGKALSKKQLYGVAFEGEFDFEKVAAYAESNNQTDRIIDFQNHAGTFVETINAKQKEMTISEFLNYINSADALQQNAMMYSKYIAKVGDEEQFAGTNLIADWYKTNLYIYTNALNIIENGDSKLLLVIGQGHIPILKHLFSTNPDFEIIEVADLLN